MSEKREAKPRPRYEIKDGHQRKPKPSGLKAMPHFIGIFAWDGAIPDVFELRQDWVIWYEQPKKEADRDG
jgi:hypothetical protein